MFAAKQTIIFLVLIGLVIPLTAEVDFTTFVAIEHDPNKAASSTRKVDVFVLSSILSGIECDPLYVREQKVEHFSGPELTEEQNAIAQAEETMTPFPTSVTNEELLQQENETVSAHLETTQASELPEPFTPNAVTQEQPLECAKPAPPIAANEELANAFEKQPTVCIPYCPCGYVEPFCPPCCFGNWSVLAGVGYRRDNLNWTSKHIHHDFGLDKAKAKDRFENIDIFLLTTTFRGTLCNCLYVRGTADYGWIFDGRETQKDIFELHNRTVAGSKQKSTRIEFKEHNKIKSGTVTDLSVALGFPILFKRHCCCDCCNCCQCSCNPFSALTGIFSRFTQFQYDPPNDPPSSVLDPAIIIAPLAGVSFRSMEFDSGNGNVLVRGPLTPITPPYYSGIQLGKQATRHSNSRSERSKHAKLKKSSYADLWSPFIGLDFAYPVKCFVLFGECEFHVGRLHWRCSNRIPTRELWSVLHEDVEFTFRRTKTVYGLKFKTGLRGPLCHCWFYEIDLSYQDYSTFKNNPIDWQSFEINLQIGRIF